LVTPWLKRWLTSLTARPKLRSMDRLFGVRRSYDWGSISAIAELLSEKADGQPWAEHWFGAHPLAPALLSNGRTLAAVIAEDRAATLGPKVADQFDSLPFLVKFLAAESPLSLQVHPSLQQAQVGFDREEAAGVPVDAPNRSFRDRRHKPELILALTEFDALCGFRAPNDTLALFDDLRVDELRPVQQMLAGEPSATGLYKVLVFLLGLDPAAGTAMADGLAHACSRSGSAASAAERAMLVQLADRYPGDPGLVVAALLNLVRLAPGQAMFLDAGNLHAYLSGVAVEVMANSDNVVRGGLTSKHVDQSTLLEIVNTSPIVPLVQQPSPVDGLAWFDVPVDDFALARLDVGTSKGLGALPGPAIALCVDGSVAANSMAMSRGEAVWVAANDEPVTFEGSGTVLWATVGGTGRARDLDSEGGLLRKGVS